MTQKSVLSSVRLVFHFKIRFAQVDGYHITPLYDQTVCLQEKVCHLNFKIPKVPFLTIPGDIVTLTTDHNPMSFSFTPTARTLQIW